MKIISTLKSMFSNAMATPSPSLIEQIRHEQRKSVLRAISYAGEGNIKLQTGRIMFEKDIEALKNRVLKYSFTQNKNL